MEYREKFDIIFLERKLKGEIDMNNEHEKLMVITQFMGVLNELVKVSDICMKTEFTEECMIFCNTLESVERNLFLTILSTTFNTISTEEQTEMLEQRIGDEENFELLYKNFVSYEEFDNTEEVTDLLLFYLTDFNQRLAKTVVEEEYKEKEDIKRVSTLLIYEVEEFIEEIRKKIKQASRKRNIIEITTFKTKKDNVSYFETILLMLQEVQEVVTPFAFLEFE